MSNSILRVLVESVNGHFVSQSEMTGGGCGRLVIGLMWLLSVVLFGCGLVFVLMNASVGSIESGWLIAVISGGQVMVTSLVSWQDKEGERAYDYIRDLVTGGLCGSVSRISDQGGVAGDLCGSSRTSDTYQLWVMSVDMRASVVSVLFFGSLYIAALVYGAFSPGGFHDLTSSNAGFAWLCGLFFQLICFVVCTWRLVRPWLFFIALHDGERVRFMESVYGELRVSFSMNGGNTSLPYGRLSRAGKGVERHHLPCLIDGASKDLPLKVERSMDVGYHGSLSVRPDGRKVVD